MSLDARALVSCFCSVWCVRIKVRVAREESEGGFWRIGGRVEERRWGFRRFGFFFFFVAIIKSYSSDG